MPLRLLLGGARSGKSALAVRLAHSWAGPIVFVATAEARDADMAERIDQHRRDRPAEWTTVEEPIDLAAALRDVPADSFIVVDCLSLWVANLLEAGWTAERIAEEARTVVIALSSRVAPSVVVSNEVGLGIVPATELGRTYRDVLGRVNAVFAKHAEPAQLIVAGRALDLGSPPA
jgi:adenosylcobinamide kinase / adenosylcobinamide-phosphate guanylyltransferase